MSDKKDLNQTKDLDNKNNNSSIDQSRRKFTQAGVAAPIILSVASQPVWGNQCSISGAQSGPHSGEQVVNCAGCTPGYWKRHVENWPWPEGSEPIPGETDVFEGSCSPLSPGSSGSTCKVYFNDGTKFDEVFPGGQAWLLSGTIEGYWDPTLKNGDGDWRKGDFYTYRNLPDGTLPGYGLPVDGQTLWQIHGTSVTLMQVLWMAKENQTVPAEIAFAFHLVAAYLNALSFPELYGYTGPQIVDLYLNAKSGFFPEGMSSVEDLKDALDFMNNRGCIM